LNVTLALSADSAGVAAAIADPDRPDGSSIETFGMPAAFGAGARLYHITYTDHTGAARETWQAMWARGTVVIEVAGDGPPGQFTAQQVIDFSGTTDADYQQGSVPDILTRPLTPSPISPPVSPPTT
jgi:hypothetical protein